LGRVSIWSGRDDGVEEKQGSARDSSRRYVRDPCDVTADRPRPDGVASWTLGCDDPAGRLALVLADDTTWTDQ